MTAIILAICGLAITIIGLIVKLTTFTTEIRMHVTAVLKEMPAVKRIPMLDYRVRVLEKHLDISTPEMMNGNHVRVGGDDEQ
jgi:hypothetical protein